MINAPPLLARLFSQPRLARKMNLDTPRTHIMATDPITVDIGNALSDVHRALAKERFQPVLENDKLVGIISQAGLLRYGLADEEPSSHLDQRTRIADIMRTDLVTCVWRSPCPSPRGSPHSSCPSLLFSRL